MPVTPLPPSNTKRYFVHHTVAGIGHDFLCRVGPSVTDAAAVTQLGLFVSSNIDHFTTNTVFDGLEVSAVGSDVRLPVSGWTPQTGTGGTTTTGDARGLQVTATGRGTSGRKARVGFFGMLISPDGDFRLNSGDAVVIDIVSSLGGISDFFLAIDGTSVTWHNYLNYGYNDHWVAELRT